MTTVGGTAPVRRSQAERSAISMVRMVDAAVRSLFQQGYGATTVTAVVEGAGTSRGAFLHHFPSKQDLMVAVVRRAWEVDRRDYVGWFAGIRDPAERFLRFVEPGWKALSSPHGVAVLEILIACRSDASLAQAVAPVQVVIQGEARQLVYDEITGPLGLTDAESADFFRFAEATVRGLVTDLMITRNAASVEPTLECIKLVASDILARLR